MLFKQRFHEGIVGGSITLTFRAWDAARVSSGRRYRFGASGRFEVDAVDRVALGSITDREARRAGFDSADELHEFVRKEARRRLTARSTLFRVAFHYLGDGEDPRTALQSDRSAKALDEVAARLERMDRLSRRGPWTVRVLELIGKHPRTAASILAPRLRRPTPAFKADVRKLKNLGLTVSHEVGYTLSPRGKALLARLRERPR